MEGYIRPFNNKKIRKHAIKNAWFINFDEW